MIKYFKNASIKNSPEKVSFLYLEDNQKVQKIHRLLDSKSDNCITKSTKLDKSRSLYR